MDNTTSKSSYGYGKRPLWQWVAIYVVIGAVIYGLVYYFVFANKGGSNYGQTVQYQSPAQNSPVVAQPSASPALVANAQQIALEGNEFAFSPSTFTVKAGRPVQVTFKNTGKYPHNFVVSDLNVQSKTIQSGQTDTVTFTPTSAGTFSYICSVPGHTDKGMKGVLTVQ